MTAEMTVLGSTPVPLARRAASQLYVGVAFAAVLTLAAGFGRSFYLRPLSPPPLVILHGAAFTGWVVLFLAQALLVSARRVALHRWMGGAGAVLAVVLLATAVPVAFAAARRGSLPGDPLAFLLIMLVDLLLFTAFGAAGLLLRHRSEVHRRLMLLALISILPPAVSRWPMAVNRPAVIAIVMVAFLAAAPAADRLSGLRVHPVSLWGGLVVIASMPVRFAVSTTHTWHRIASWLIR